MVSSHLAQQVNYKSHDFHMHSNFWKETSKIPHHDRPYWRKQKPRQFWTVNYTVKNNKSRGKPQMKLWKVGFTLECQKYFCSFSIQCSVKQTYALWGGCTWWEKHTFLSAHLHNLTILWSQRIFNFKYISYNTLCAKRYWLLKSYTMRGVTE